jgi:uncharacterized protein YbgA (DUF1722 family)
MRAMKVLTTPKKHANVLMHIMGFFKESLAAEDKAELFAAIHAGLRPVRRYRCFSRTDSHVS